MALTFTTSTDPKRVSILRKFDIILTLTANETITGSEFVYTLDSDFEYIEDDYSGSIVGQIITFDTGDFEIDEEKVITITVKVNRNAGTKTNNYDITSNEYNHSGEDEITIYTFSFTGYYPFDVEKIGNRFPAVLIEKGNENDNIWQGGIVQTIMTVNLYIYNNYNGQNDSENEIEQLVKIQNDALYSVISDLSMSSNIDCIENIEVIIGEMRQNFDSYSPNYTKNKSLILIKIDLRYREER